AGRPRGSRASGGRPRGRGRATRAGRRRPRDGRGRSATPPGGPWRGAAIARQEHGGQRRRATFFSPRRPRARPRLVTVKGKGGPYAFSFADSRCASRRSSNRRRPRPASAETPVIRRPSVLLTPREPSSPVGDAGIGGG